MSFITLSIGNLSGEGAIPNHALLGIGVTSGLIGLAIAVVLCILAGIHHTRLGKRSWHKVWSTIENNLSIVFYIALIFGFIVYSVGMIPQNITEFNLRDSIIDILGMAPMAIIHSFGMFILQSDVSEIHNQCFNNFIFMTSFSLAHALAAFVSMAFVIKHFGYNIVSKIRLYITSTMGGKVNNLYIFWGMNEPSYLLAKSIKQPSSRIVFINSTDNTDNKESMVGIDRLFSFLSFKNDELDKFKDLDCLIANTFHRLSKAGENHSLKSANQILKEHLRLPSIVKLIHNTEKEIHIFMLSEDSHSNIKAVDNLLQDQNILDSAKANRKIKVYCHSRYDSVSRVIEDNLSTENIDIKIVDSSHESINELKCNAKFHPINFVDIDTTDNIGTVKSAFNCMVIGFGETGQDALRFLYEFGAFVDTKSDKDDDVKGILPNGELSKVFRSPFHCDIVDPNIDKISGRFFANAPAMKQTQTVVDENGNAIQQEMITEHCFDTESPQFYQLINERAEKLNYIIISTNNDDANITIAVRLFNKIRAIRQDLSHFIILVRCSMAGNIQNLNKIANHYNAKTDANNPHIFIFGTNDSIYTYTQIVDNHFELQGKKYNEIYCNLNKSDENDRWDKRRAKAIKKGTIDSFRSLRRKESQDVANAYHSLTKSIVLT